MFNFPSPIFEWQASDKKAVGNHFLAFGMNRLGSEPATSWSWSERSNHKAITSVNLRFTGIKFKWASDTHLWIGKDLLISCSMKTWFHRPDKAITPVNLRFTGIKFKWASDTHLCPFGSDLRISCGMKTWLRRPGKAIYTAQFEIYSESNLSELSDTHLWNLASDLRISCGGEDLVA